MGENVSSGYQLRYAAGEYWILDMEQEGVPYKKPLSVNAVGAEIWQMMEAGMGEREIADCLCREYQVERNMVLGDMEQFRERLREFGVSL